MTPKRFWLEKFKKDFKGKKVLIMGLGLLGRGVADVAFFAKIGAKVTVTDLKTTERLQPSLKKLKKFSIKYVLGKHQKQDFLKADLILRNAAVPQDSPFLKIARKNKVCIEMDESLFAKYAPVKIIGVTGTRGKSTTTILIYKILKKAGFSVWLGGNILQTATLPLLEKVKKDDWVVMELSSWQLQGFDEAKISPHIGVVTNIFEDHLNHYSSMKAYVKDKKVIFKYQTKKDFLILSQDSAIVKKFAQEARSKVIWFSQKDFPKNWHLKIKGGHNKANAVAAIKVAEILKIDKGIVRKVIESFPGLPFRLETVARIDNVLYVNDTTSTTPVATIAALETFNKPVILIAGGASKNLKMVELAKQIAQIVKKVIFLEGSETANLVRLIKKFGAGEKIVGVFDEMKKAFLKAREEASAGDIVLLSPGCASFGMFENEFDRGEQFNKIVRSLKIVK